TCAALSLPLSFPTRRSSDLRAVFGDVADEEDGSTRSLGVFEQHGRTLSDLRHASRRGFEYLAVNRLDGVDDQQVRPYRFSLPDEDRKSTRLNSSHVSISYAV